ncbi:hypothetical protein C7T94_01780 [Pedobacter yulinensis]|uniref:Glycosyltransferase 61 catalytic domain-containing protein n=1 Tax=Pedobacter yulinensis TaxID=2126353 RepID=A0A2T3HR23_9SPHI|nr:glycosyltransferase family 61 protein [Pedobacter yulinensis]PST84879.1 hypothetical protein C7T94_01780 [Pedobacter yulinensis]
MEHILDRYTITRSMPANYRPGDLDFCRKEFAYETYDVDLVSLRHCVVNKKGFVYERGRFEMNKISLLDERRYTHLFGKKHYVKKVLFKRKRKLPKGKYLLAFDEWTSEHYHWFCDFLPRLFVIRDRLPDFILLLPDTAYVRNTGLQTLQFFGLEPAAIEFIVEDELVQANNLSVATHVCLTGYINDRIMQQMRELIVTKLDISEGLGRKLYISREKARYRRVLNEVAVQQAVREMGYEVISYEDLNWEEQVRLTASADSIVSMHGAGLVNSLFMRPNGCVLEFRRDKIYHNQCYWHLAASIGHRYFYLFGTPDRDDLVLEGGEGCNLTIDTDKLQELLLVMESQTR